MSFTVLFPAVAVVVVAFSSTTNDKQEEISKARSTASESLPSIQLAKDLQPLLKIQSWSRVLMSCQADPWDLLTCSTSSMTESLLPGGHQRTLEALLFSDTLLKSVKLRLEDGSRLLLLMPTSSITPVLVWSPAPNTGTIRNWHSHYKHYIGSIIFFKSEYW